MRWPLHTDRWSTARGRAREHWELAWGTRSLVEIVWSDELIEVILRLRRRRARSST